MIELNRITIEDRRELWQLSSMFQDFAEKHSIGNTWKYQDGMDDREMHIRRRWFGFCGGFMLSRMLDLPWHEGHEDKWQDRHKYGDVGDLDVRTRSKHWHNLTIRTMDTRPSVLIKPKTEWDIESASWHEIPPLYAAGWHLPWFVRRYGEELPQKGVYALNDALLIPVQLLGKSS